LKDKSVFLKQLNDSTGNILAENGKGRWKEYNENFSAINTEGEVSHGLKDGQWQGRMNDSVNFAMEFDKGKITSSATFYQYKYKPKYKYKQPANTYTKVDKAPEFKGGPDEFHKFVDHHLIYPSIAREDGTQGIVMIGFVIEKDGSVSNVETITGIGDGCDEQAIRVIKLSSPWKPGILNGNAVRVACIVPFQFTLAKVK
jgi:TonB family protein